MKIYIKTYGVAYVEEINGRREIIAAVNNVTADPEFAERLVKLFNKEHLSPEHMQDVIHDLLALN